MMALILLLIDVCALAFIVLLVGRVLGKFKGVSRKVVLLLGAAFLVFLVQVALNTTHQNDYVQPEGEKVNFPDEPNISRESLWTEANKYREDPLPLDPVLNESAEKRCDQIVASGELSHEGFQDTVDELNRHAGENLANGYTSSAELLAGWSTSPTHKRNLENPVWNHVGYGICIHTKLGVVVVQHFSD